MMTGQYNKLLGKSKGFTLVELLIVIVVIAILAAISVVAYNGIQERARDTQRKSDLAQIAKALRLYAVDNGNHVSGGCAQSGGWYDYDYDGAGSLDSIAGCLEKGGYLSKRLTDPLQTRGCVAVSAAPSGQECFRYMKYDCSGGTTYVFANLETMPRSATDTDNTCMTTIDSGYGMNYSVRVN